MKAERGGEAEQGQRAGRVGQLPAKQHGNAGAELQRDHQRQQQARDMVGSHVIEERLRARDFRDPCKYEQQRQQRAAGNRDGGGRHGVLPYVI